MPVVRFARKVVSVPDTWEGWAMRLLTVGIVVVLAAGFLLMGQVAALREQVANGRAERNAYQTEQSIRMCAALRAVVSDPKVVKETQC